MSSNNNRFSDRRFITSVVDLRNLLKQCSKCYKLTENANFIFPIESLDGVYVPANKEKKSFLIVNIKTGKSGSVDDETIGHWIGLACYLTNKQCVIIDPGNRYRDYPDVMTQLQNFCKLNKLEMFNYATQFQQNSSFICGQLCAFFCAKVHWLSFSELLTFRNMIRSYSIHFNEENMMSYVQKHFKITF